MAKYRDGKVIRANFSGIVDKVYVNKMVMDIDLLKLNYDKMYQKLVISLLVVTVKKVLLVLLQSRRYIYKRWCCSRCYYESKCPSKRMTIDVIECAFLK